jgi:hypothetical protein
MIAPYDLRSMSSKRLAEATGLRRIRRNGSKFRGGPNYTVINWGRADKPDWHPDTRILNKPSAVVETANKLRFMEKASVKYPHLIPDWTDSRERAIKWGENNLTVFARTVLHGHSGKGIVIVQPGDRVPEAPLYTAAFPKTAEFRIHVGCPLEDHITIIGRQQKKRKLAVPDDEVNWQIRNKKGGFVYARNNIDVPPKVEHAAMNVFLEFGLDFGAIDVMWNEEEKSAIVLEINSAPGLRGSTIGEYQNFFSGLM